jgi:hypothetical protein
VGIVAALVIFAGNYRQPGRTVLEYSLARPRKTRPVLMEAAPSPGF